MAKNLSDAQLRALNLYSMGRSDEIRSGPHLRALAARGLIARLPNASQYGITADGLHELRKELGRSLNGRENG